MPAAEVTFTPAAAAYSAGDIMEGAKPIYGLGAEAGGDYILTSADLIIAATGVQSGETSYRLHLYSVTPPSALADNALWDLPAGDRASYLGYVDLGTPIDVGASLHVQVTQLNKQISLPAGGDLFAYLQTIGAFTATAAARTVRLQATRL